MTDIDSDEKAIRAVLDGVYRAWAANDADAFVAEYTEDATAILPGSFRPGREAIRASMAAGFAGPLKGSSARDTVQSVRMVGTDAAIVVSEAGILMAGESEVPAGRAVMATWVLEKQDGAWRIAAYHNCAKATG